MFVRKTIGQTCLVGRPQSSEGSLFIISRIIRVKLIPSLIMKTFKLLLTF